jgi:DNA-binding transcriptional regulator YiaG
MDSRDLRTLINARAAALNGSGRAARQRAQLSLAEVAAAVGITEAALSRWERGARRPQGRPAIEWGRLLAELDRLSDSTPRDAA